MSTPFRRQGLQDSPFTDSPLAAQSIADYSDAHRLRLVDHHQDSDAGQRRAYVAALNEVAGKHLLPQERQFLARFNQSQPQTTCHSRPIAGPLPDRSPPGTPSTTLTDMNLEQRAQQIPRHSAKIVNLWEHEVREGHVTDRVRTRRGTRGGESSRRKQAAIMMPPEPPEPMPDRRALPSDVSDVASNASTAGFISHANGLVLPQPSPPLSSTRHDERPPSGVAGDSTGIAAAHVQEVAPLSSSFFFSANDNGSRAFPRPNQLQQPEPSMRDTSKDDHNNARAQLEHLTQELVSAQSSYKKHAQALVDVDAEIKHLSACVLRLTFQDSHHQQQFGA
ncbi:hypothetical protein CGRA01v4_15022 [Colletotrichum graminicola]|uniref:Uncharacterized protein n=1 Tax=Colletotrichum graminicola (strain M1.001 / M2 / FGSC 10212) TaxID=645133 RepID=E3QYH3_COLGM|nr:uncharacterized protein GLRG_11019 [Colletotrichum graminicola M1.001]EFQ35911.1 hypothetical protein GLRG_11019 [Colletotrichum graminicola M1.001]WDK23730.1 hypothetical protein CGRA01v4_15022 [Colletotrichum graminicola]